MVDSKHTAMVVTELNRRFPSLKVNSAQLYFDGDVSISISGTASSLADAQLLCVSMVGGMFVGQTRRFGRNKGHRQLPASVLARTIDVTAGRNGFRVRAFCSFRENTAPTYLAAILRAQYEKSCQEDALSVTEPKLAPEEWRDYLLNGVRVADDLIAGPLAEFESRVGAEYRINDTDRARFLRRAQACFAELSQIAGQLRIESSTRPALRLVVDNAL